MPVLTIYNKLFQPLKLPKGCRKKISKLFDKMPKRNLIL